MPKIYEWEKVYKATLDEKDPAKIRARIAAAEKVFETRRKAIKGLMAQDAGTTFTTQQSLDILSYLLQQNGLPPEASHLRTRVTCHMFCRRFLLSV